MLISNFKSDSGPSFVERDDPSKAYDVNVSPAVNSRLSPWRLGGNMCFVFHTDGQESVAAKVAREENIFHACLARLSGSVGYKLEVHVI